MTYANESRGGLDEMFSPVGENAGTFSPLQLHFLRRLNRLLQLRREQGSQLNGEGVRLLDRAIYSTYCDLVDLGVASEAQKLLHRSAVFSNQQEEQ